MKKTNRLVIRDILIITTVFLVATVILYGYYWFFTAHKLQLVYQNWDGPSYVVVAKSFYNPEIIKEVNNTKLSNGELSMHFPLYPLLIRTFSFIGYYRSMLFVSLLFSLLSVIALYFLVKKVYPQANALLVALPLIFFTPRWFIISHVGSSEPLILFFTILFLIFYVKKKYLLSAVFASLAQMGRPQAILIFAGLFFYYLYTVFVLKTIKPQKAIKEFLPFFLIPLTLFLVFLLYQIQMGDFFAFFHGMSVFKHMNSQPYYVFTRYLLPIDMGIWKEALAFDYLLYLSAALYLFREKALLPFAFIATTLYAPIPFVAHVDISRYAIPLLPFVFLAFYKFFSGRAFLLALLITTPAIYQFAIGFMNFNLSP